MKQRPHRKGRPPRDARDVLALAENGRWIKDDGKPHRAFSYRAAEGWPVALAQECGCSLGLSDASGDDQDEPTIPLLKRKVLR